MDLSEILLILHIVGVATWFGANIVQAVTPSLAARQGAQVAAGWYRITEGLSTRLYIPAGILVALTGIGLVLDSEGAYSFGSTFVGIGLGVVIIGALLGSLVFGPGARKAASAVEAGDQAEVRRTASRLAGWGVVDTLLLLVAITTMVIKLGA
jgi:hypothetical protein